MVNNVLLLFLLFIEYLLRLFNSIYVTPYILNCQSLSPM